MEGRRRRRRGRNRRRRGGGKESHLQANSRVDRVSSAALASGLTWGGGGEEEVRRR